MEYVALHISCPDEERAEILTAELAEWPFESFIQEGGELIVGEKSVGGGVLVAYIQKSALADCRAEVDAMLVRYGVEGRYEPIVSQNWNAVWERDFPPVEVEGRLVIRAPFHAPAPAGTMEVVLTPHNSFGTGHHATTWMMARELLDLSVAGRRGLDLGSGTGVLAILAAKCGAAHVDAVDIDDWCEASCRENAAMNGVADRVEPILGDVGRVAGRCYDFIVANINRNILLSGLECCSGMLNAGGTMLMSGFLEEDVATLVAAAEERGLRHVATRSREEWRLLRLQK